MAEQGAGSCQNWEAQVNLIPIPCPQTLFLRRFFFNSKRPFQIYLKSRPPLNMLPPLSHHTSFSPKPLSSSDTIPDCFGPTDGSTNESVVHDLSNVVCNVDLCKWSEDTWYALTHSEKMALIPPVHTTFLAGLDADTTTHVSHDVEEHTVGVCESH